MVEKSGVERSGVEAWGLKVRGWNFLQPYSIASQNRLEGIESAKPKK
jgi:hypothetical protein